MRAPRTPFHTRRRAPESCRLPRRTMPETCACGGVSPMTASIAWLLPAPDSPTSARHSPAATVKDRSLTASTGARALPKRTLNPSTLSTGVAASAASGLAGIERIAQTVADEVEAEEQRHEYARRHEEHPGRGLHVLRTIANETAETRERLLHAETQEAQKALEQDHLRHGERGVDDDGTQHVGHHVAQQDVVRAGAARARSLDEGLMAKRHGLTTHDACHGEPADCADGSEKHVRIAAPEQRRERDHEEQVRQRVEYVDRAHHGAVRAAADVARGRA